MNIFINFTLTNSSKSWKAINLSIVILGFVCGQDKSDIIFGIKFQANLGKY